VTEGYEMRKYELLFILFLAILSSRDLSFKKLKIFHDELLYDKI
jgi:hypothetical protein